MNARLAPLGLLAAAALLTPTGALADGGPPVVWTLTLEGAEPEKGGDLLVVLERREDTVRGTAFTPGAGKASHEVNAKQVAVTDRKVEGEVVVTLRSDGWWPAEPAPAEPYVLNVTRAGGTAGGTWRPGGGSPDASGGKVKASVRTLAGEPAASTLRFSLFGVPIPGVKKWQTQTLVTLMFDPRGRAVGAMARVTGSPTYAEWTGHVEDLRVTRRRFELAGTLTLVAATNKGATVRLPLAVEGLVLGDAVGGSYAVGGESAAVGRIAGEALPSPPANVAAGMHLELHHALPGGEMLRLYLAADGEGGFGFSPTYNRAVHRVDTAGLTRKGDRLTGTLKVTVRPDPYVPKDRQDREHAFSLDARLTHAAVAGTFTRGDGAEGRLIGRLLPPPPDAPLAGVWVKFEQGVTGGNPWFNRAFAGVTYEGGRVAGGSFSNNKNGWKGEFNGADLTLKDGRLTGPIDGTVTSGKTRTGRYTFQLDAHVIGGILAGSADVLYEGAKVKTTDVLGSVELGSD